MDILKRISIFSLLIFLILSGNITAQIAWSHSSGITDIVSDSLGEIYFKDINGSFFDFINQERFVRMSKVPESLQLIIADGQVNREYNLGSDRIMLTESCIVRITENDQKQFCKSFPFSCAAKYKDGLLLGTHGNGLWIYDQDAIRKFYINGVSFPDDIIDLQVTNGRIWILAQSGSLYLFDIYLQLLKPVSKEINAFHVDRWEVIWTTQGSLLKKDLRYINDAPPVLSVDTDSQLDLNKDHLNINYETYFNPDPGSVEIEYSLEAKDWIKVKNEGRLLISDLKPGTNSISVRAKSEAFQTKEFRITYTLEQAWWKTYWPLIFGALLLLLIFTVIAQVFQNKTRRRLKLEADAIRKELKSLKLQHKMGQLQMNPHFLFNALNSISGLVAVGQQKEARKCLNSFAQIMRTMLDASTKEWITLEEEEKFLQHYLQLEQMAHAQKFDFEIVNQVEKHCMIPPMIIQPFVENAILHGIKHKKGTGKIEIKLIRTDDFVEAEILDNGIGRKASAQYRKEGHSSHAMKIIRDRISALVPGKNNENIIFEDLNSITGEALGTKVSILIPYTIN